MVKILNSVKNDIDITAGLNDNQIYALNQILIKYSDKNEYDEDKIMSSSFIIDKIEDIVNQLYKMGKIRNLEIKQNTETEYEFSNIVVELKIENDTLMVEKEEITLQDWLLLNFSTSNDNSFTDTKKSKKIAEGKSK